MNIRFIQIFIIRFKKNVIFAILIFNCDFSHLNEILFKRAEIH